MYLLTAAEAKAIIDAQVEIVQTQWPDVTDAVQLTELERRQLMGREILNEFAFRDCTEMRRSPTQCLLPTRFRRRATPALCEDAVWPSYLMSHRSPW